ncbi:serine/threonine-protein kinase [Streptomyces sp. NPDC059349]|uniref:serine/threonine-protein kinase n=1 Tax=Streptomyces sp. NPDC059349 TaxID=3346808 RepID=UPI0036A9D28F
MRDQLLGGRYRLARQLGQGGMGQVWEAQDETLGRPVALKVISLLAGGGSHGDEARARFLREARITARLQHTNIVTIHDLGETGTADNRVPFLVLELVRGEGLDVKLRRDVVTLPDAARWGAQICDALTDAHNAGIMHRDIKPSNILITPSSNVKVLDFGIARAADPYATADRLTQTGFIVGTPPYMAPEQARGFPEPRSDLYALGCLLFELITGQLPFQAPDTVGYLTAHLTQEPPAPSSVSADVPPAWDDLVLTLLDKDPDQRYPNAASLAQALRHLDHAPEPSTGESTPPPTMPATTALRVIYGDAPRRIALAMRALLAQRTAETVAPMATLQDHLLKVASPPSLPLVVDAEKTAPQARVDLSPPRSAPEGPGRRAAQWERFGPPAAMFVLVNMSSDFWLTDLGPASFWVFEVWLVRSLVVGLLVFTAVLTPRSKGVTRGVGYGFASFAAFGFVMGVTQGPGPTLAHDLPLYLTATLLSIAAYCYRDIKTRRARSLYGTFTHTTSDTRAGDLGN